MEHSRLAPLQRGVGTRAVPSRAGAQKPCRAVLASTNGNADGFAVPYEQPARCPSNNQWLRKREHLIASRF